MPRTIATNTTGAATAANQATGNASLATIAPNSSAPLPAQSNRTTNIGTVDGGVNVTPTDCSGSVTAGGTAQIQQRLFFKTGEGTGLFDLFL